MKTPTAKRRWYLSLWLLVAMLTGVFYGAASGYRHWSAAHLTALSGHLGEVWMERAARCEAAGALEEALAHYQRALAGTFHGDHNQNHCEKHTGLVLLQLGRPGEALPHLQRAQDSPLRTLTGYEPLVETLMALARWDEARVAADAWAGLAGDDPERLADARRAQGRIAVQRGDLDAAEQCFRQAVQRQPDHESQADLAKLLALRGDRAGARAAMESFLAAAPPGKDTEAHWAALAAWSN